MAKAGKGSEFERGFAKELSKWWTGDEDTDDVFWRSQASGARATSRSKVGKRTIGQHGDIAATDERGQALMRLLCFELKRGYNRFTIQDLLDRPDHSQQLIHEQWIEQSMRACVESNSISWCIVFRRDMRRTLMMFDHEFYKTMQEWNCFSQKIHPKISLKVPVRNDNKESNHSKLVVMLAREWFTYGNPTAFKAMSRHVT